MLAPLVGVFSAAVVNISLAKTAIMRAMPMIRRIANAPASGVGLIVAASNGAQCATSAGGLIVCGGAANNPGGGGTTIGDVFVTDKSTSVVLQNPELIKHELRHSDQWAGWGPFLYPVAYGVAATYSTVTAGNYACGNYFEFDANFGDGGYQC